MSNRAGILRQLLVFLFLAEIPAHAGSTNAILLPDLNSVIKWEMHSHFTNGTDIVCPYGYGSLWPTNFLTDLKEEVNSSNFVWLISQGSDPGLPQPKNTFEMAFGSGDQKVCSIRANCPINETNSPPWMKRLQFYVSSRFDGHSPEYVRQALEQQSAGTNCALPVGFSRYLEEAYWVPTNWLQEDTFDLDATDMHSPSHESLGRINLLWVVRDGQFAWTFGMDYFGGPISQRRDAQEYDPKNRLAFEAATKEAWEIIKKKGGLIDSPIPLDFEVQRILNGKYGINWSTPLDLQQ